MPGRIQLDGGVEEQHIRETLTKLFERHESFRTSFKEVDKTPVQFVTAKADAPIRSIDISGLQGEEKEKERERIYEDVARSPFDLEQPPIFRSVLVKLTNDEHELIFNKHHIITDGWSNSILAREFMQIYDGYRTGNCNGNGLPHLELQYKDFCYWHNRQLIDPVLNRESHEFWKDKLLKGYPSLQLPVYSNEQGDGRTGAALMTGIDQNLLGKLNQLAYTQNTSLFTVLFAVYMLVLNHFTNQEDIACSIISAGRDHISLGKYNGVLC